jgi:hypothetical protein
MVAQSAPGWAAAEKREAREEEMFFTRLVCFPRIAQEVRAEEGIASTMTRLQ